MLVRASRLSNLKATIEEAVALADAAGENEVRKILELSVQALRLRAERSVIEFRAPETRRNDLNHPR